MKKTIEILIIGILLLVNVGAFSVASVNEANMEKSETGTVTVTGKIYTKLGGATAVKPYIWETAHTPHGNGSISRLVDSYDRSDCSFVYTVIRDVEEGNIIDIQPYLGGYESKEKSFNVTANNENPHQFVDLGDFYLDQKIGGRAKLSINPSFNDVLVRFLDNHPMFRALLGL